MEEDGRPARHSPPGWALVEILISLVLAAFFVALLVQAVKSVHCRVADCDRAARLRQTLAAAVFLLSRDLRMTGCNPSGAPPPLVLDLEDIVEQGDRLTIRMDKRGPGAHSGPDGDMEDPDERIQFYGDFRNGVLRRNGQPIALGLERNAGGEPLFLVRSTGGARMLETTITLAEGDRRASLSACVQFRNPW